MKGTERLMGSPCAGDGGRSGRRVAVVVVVVVVVVDLRLREWYKILGPRCSNSCPCGRKTILIPFRAPPELSDHPNTQNLTANSILRVPGSRKAPKDSTNAKNEIRKCS